jgi:chromosome segregation ATPase
MNKLSKQQEREKDEHMQEIRLRQTELNAAITVYNTKLEEIKTPVEKALETLNEKITAANEFLSNINADQESYYDERSEKWQEGDKGSEYSTWKDQFGEEFEEVTIDFPEELEEVDCNYDNTLENLPCQPE